MTQQTNFMLFFLCPCSWDEWVAESRVLKYNDANVQKQKDLSRQHCAKNKKGIFGSDSLF